MNGKSEEEIYRFLSVRFQNRAEWENTIPKVGDFLTSPSNRIRAKALWVMGEMGLQYPTQAAPFLPQIAACLQDEDDKVRERAVGALGRIGRADPESIAPYLGSMLDLSRDYAANVRLNVIWASENIATTAPTLYRTEMNIFSALLDDTDLRVRMEAPEIFRVIGKRIPELVIPYLEKLKKLSEQDEGRVVRIHAQGAIKAVIQKQKTDQKQRSSLV